MKWYSPFLIFALLLWSCKNSTKPNYNTTKNGIVVADLIDKGNDIKLSAKERFAAFDKADTFAKGNTVLENLVANNRLYVVISAFPDSMAKATPAFKKIEADTSDNPYKAYYQSAMASYFMQQQQVDSAFQLYIKAKDQAILHNDSLNAGYCLIRTAELWQTYNDYHQSESDAIAALKLLKHQKNNEYLAEVYNILGISYTFLKDFPKAITAYNKAASFATTDLQKQILKNNIGSVYAMNGNFDKAISVFKGLLASKVIMVDQSSKARVLDNLGYALFKKDFGGLDEMQYALKIRESLNEKNEIASSALHLHDYYYHHGDVSLAMVYARRALVEATAVNATDDRLTAMKYIAELSFGAEEKNISARHRQLTDSIGEVRIRMTNNFAEDKYNYQLATDYAATMKKNAALEVKNKMIILYCGIGAIVLVVIFFLYKTKKEKQLSTYKTETRIAKRIHDELANDVFYTMSFAEKEDLSSSENRETLLNNLDNIYYRTRDISRDLNTIDTGVEFPERLRELMSGFHGIHTNVIAIGLDAVQWEKVSTAKKIATYRVIQEWLTNMKKHSNAGMVVLNYKIQKNKLVVTYSDDGVGLASESIAAKKMIPDTENRIKEVNGKYTFETSEKGLKVSLSIPL
ncbi:MAG: hypothetical protein PSV16_06110 [Flavobacterium sp.]|nr:hypothetical protein [Flavobacterium sp.]